MSEKLVSLAASVLKVDPTTLSTEEGIAAAEEKAKSLKVMTSDEFNSTLNNYRESLKDTLYKEHKINIHSSIEKNLIEKYGLDENEFKGKRTDEYIDRIIELKSKANPTGADTKELEKLTKLLQDSKSEFERQLGETKKEYETRIRGMMLEGELKAISPIIDTDDDKKQAQLDFIKYQFEKEYRFEEREGNIVVLKGDEIVRDADFKPVSVGAVLAQLAEKFAPIKQKAPAGRKPAGGGKGSESTVDWSQFESFDDFQKTDSGKNLTMGSAEWIKLYGEFRKAKGL